MPKEIFIVVQMLFW